MAATSAAQQVADTSFAPPIGRPAYDAGRGPRVAIDEAHLNFHTADGRYAPFATLLRRDGYQVQSSRDPFTASSLARADILVVANAMHKQSENDWAPLPNLSAFTDQEVAAVEAWVRAGDRCCSLPITCRSPGTPRRSRPPLACVSRTASRRTPRATAL
jgi:hypothetical protein